MHRRARPLARAAIAGIVLSVATLAGCAAPWSRTRAATGNATPVRAVATASARPVDTPTRVAVLYGDSLSFEIRDLAVADAAAAGIHLEVRSFGGLALCDALRDLRTDLARLHPQVVVFEYAGNSFTPCMRDRAGHQLQPGSAGYVARYRAALTTAVALARAAGTRLVWASAPVSRSAAGRTVSRQLQAMARAVVASYAGARVAPAGDSVLDHGAFAARLPCLADEGPAQGCTHGSIPVRAPDGTHFCPIDPHAVRGVVWACPVYSSGARRFAAAVAGVLPVRRVAG